MGWAAPGVARRLEASSFDKRGESVGERPRRPMVDGTQPPGSFVDAPARQMTYPPGIDRRCRLYRRRLSSDSGHDPSAPSGRAHTGLAGP
jgi:hypothetical protein